MSLEDLKGRVQRLEEIQRERDASGDLEAFAIHFERLMFTSTPGAPIDLPEPWTVNVDATLEHRRTAPRAPYQLGSDEYVLTDGRVVSGEELFAAARDLWTRQPGHPYFQRVECSCMVRQFQREAGTDPR